MLIDVEFDEKRAYEVFSILDKLWVNGEGVFKDILLPQDIWPIPNDDKKLANYYFFCALAMRGGIISEDPFRWFYELLQRYPEMYDPKTVAEKWNPQKIESAIKEVTKIILGDNAVGEKEVGVIGYKLDQHSQNWFANAKTLHENWGGDLRNVYWGVSEFEEAFRRVDYRVNAYGFGGMRRKIFSLLTIWLQEKHLINVFPTPLPVDFHCLRILWASGIIDIKAEVPNAVKQYYPTFAGNPSIRVNESFIDMITRWSQKFLQKSGISHLHINPAVWVLSRDLCSTHIQNGSRGEGTILFDDKAMNKKPHKQLLKHKEPCEYCPIEHLCDGVLPAATYYRRGVLMRLKRSVFAGHLPGVDWKALAGEKLETKRRTKRNGY